MRARKISLRSFVTNRPQCVILQDCISDELMLHRGVPQGTVLGPLLFNLYIIDMATKVDNENELVQYADGTVFLTFDTSIDQSKIKLEQPNLFDIFMNITSQLIPLKRNSWYLVRAKEKISMNR